MVKMFDGNIARPRKNNGAWFLDPKSFKEFENPSGRSKRNNIFKMGSENDFAIALTKEDYHRSSHALKPDKILSNVPAKKSIKKHLENYCEKTTLHGLRYIGDSSLTLCERVFWFISFTLAIGFAAYYISNIYTKWRSSPVIISFSPFDADLSSIPFPAVTICNMNQAKKSEADRILTEGSEIEKKLLDDSCNGNANFSNTQHIAWEALRDFLVRVGNSCSDMVKSCKWGSDEDFDCSLWFNNDLTDEGLCCSFNRLPPEKIFRNSKDLVILNQTYPPKVYDWNPELGFGGTKIDDNVIPKRPLGAGAHLGLSVTLDAQVDNYFCSSTNSIGFKIIMSNPIETPKMADFGFLVSPGFETRISIEPSIREATDSLRDIAIEKRQCYFSNERPLKYYRSYSQRNCNLECQTNYTLEKCECVPYYLPKNKNIKNCGKTEQACIEDARSSMERITGNGSSCNCLPACYFLTFSHSKSMAELSDKKENIPPELKGSPAYFVKNIAVIQLYFSRTNFVKELKSELFGFTEILSNIGGLLSLFLGFSFLSLVELLYFITIRWFCHFNDNANIIHAKSKKLSKSFLK